MLAYKMFVIQTRNYVLKCVNSSVLFIEMACDKNQTYLQVRCVRDWTHLPASMFVILFYSLKFIVYYYYLNLFTYTVIFQFFGFQRDHEVLRIGLSPFRSDWPLPAWLAVSRTHLASRGEFGKLPATLGASNPGLTSLQVCLLYYSTP
jgi:hypothetical protein